MQPGEAVLGSEKLNGIHAVCQHGCSKICKLFDVAEKATSLDAVVVGAVSSF